jgi:hypothetical protein
LTPATPAYPLRSATRLNRKPTNQAPFALVEEVSFV